MGKGVLLNKQKAIYKKRAESYQLSVRFFSRMIHGGTAQIILITVNILVH